YQGKKLALSLGIKAAKNEILLLTDADCIPASPDWISHMVSPYLENENCEIVIGYSPFYSKTSLVNLSARMDNLYTASLYTSYALGKNPYMGVGRNLSYKKSLFFKNKGFASHLHIAPGDDDLFIRDVGTGTNTYVSMHPDSFVMTASKAGFAEWLRQKRRHNFAGKYYKAGHRFSLAMFMFSHFML